MAAADERIKQSKVLRGDVGVVDKKEEESLEERRRRQELVARYEEKDELEMTADGKVVKYDVAAKSKSGDQGVDRNDNAERVRQEEAAKREKQKQMSEKQKELIKKDDSKKKREEKKEDRRKKAQKQERKGKGM